MSRALWISGLIAALYVAPLGGEVTVDCIDNQGCKEGEKKFETCCKPPPCQFSNYLEYLRAKQRMMSGDRPDQALRASKGDHKKAIASLRAEVEQEGRAIRSRGDCKMGEEPYAAPTLRLTSQCRIEVFTRGSGWSEVENPLSLTERDECNEMSEAAFAEMSLRQRLCEGAVPGNTGWWAHREAGGAQDAIDVLVDHLQRWWSACSGRDIPPDVKKQLEEAGITMADPNPAREKALQDMLRSLNRKSASKPRPSVSRGGR